MNNPKQITPCGSSVPMTVKDVMNQIEDDLKSAYPNDKWALWATKISNSMNQSGFKWEVLDVYSRLTVILWHNIPQNPYQLQLVVWSEAFSATERKLQGPACHDSILLTKHDRSSISNLLNSLLDVAREATRIYATNGFRKGAHIWYPFQDPCEPDQEPWEDSIDWEQTE